MSQHRFSRRYFFYGTLLAGAVPQGGFGSTPSLKALGFKSPNEKLNIAGIGAGGRPFQDLVASEAGVENVVALADVDFVRGAQGFNRWPTAEKYRDFRRMLDRQGKQIDAVVIGTADHMHATCALWCMQAGKHVYVEKPLTRTPWEARFLTQAAEKYKVATQMGNQGYSHDATRVACEILWSGEIGEVREVHAWHGNPGWPQGMQKIPPPTPVPDTLDWDLWLGGAAARPYTAGDDDYRAFVAANMGGRGGGGGGGGRAAGRGAPDGAMSAENAAAPPAGRGARGGGGGGGGADQYGFYLPFNWRGFFDFGSGLFGDWGVHILGPANWGLQLSPEHLISVERVMAEGISPFTYPVKNAVKYEFAARGSMPPVTVYWNDSIQGDAYLPPGMTAEEARKVPGQGPQVGPAGRGGLGGRGPGQGGAPGGRAGAPDGAPGGRGGGPPQSSGYNLIFAGSKGYLGTSGRGEGVGLLPGSRWAEYKLPNAYLQRSPGASTGDNGSAHARDWVRACKGGAPACSNFGIAGPYTEWLVLGAVATHFEGKLLWDNAKGEITNNREANKWVKPTFRKGWELKP
ncbi:MAG TPA: Gfo/Idh/MocA family oxidoreductase [Bryobacteraceae bacterium]|nr:Gfo/Idh/MocA family oxidoreductase [Bryobacteraceae bacterium]